MASRASWEYRGDPERPAMLVNFSNGSIQSPESASFTLYGNKDQQTPRTKKQKILVANTSRLSYVGNNFSPDAVKSSSLCRYFVGVLNKVTGKMEVYDAEQINMQPILEEHNLSQQIPDATDQSSRTYRDKVDALIEAFGTNKQKRALNSRRLNLVGSELLSKAMEKAAEEIIDTRGTTELVNEALEKEDDLPSLFLPPCDTKADKPENVYKFNDLIPPVEYAALESVSAAFKDITSEALQQMIEQKQYASFVLHEIHDLKHSENIEKCARILWYMDALIKFSQLKSVKRKSLIDLGWPNIICNYIIKNFSVTSYRHGSIDNSVSGTMKSKIVTYVIALALHISKFQVDLTVLQRDLKLTENRILDIAKAMGLQINKRIMLVDSPMDESHKIGVLELPLAVYKQPGMMKKRKMK